MIEGTLLVNSAEVETARRAFAQNVMSKTGLKNEQLLTALSEVSREDFLGPGPWQLLNPDTSYETTPDDSPIHLYQDRAVGILPEKGLNNGQPSFLAYLISLGRPAVGDAVVHIGCGTGYYTAIIARIIGNRGTVTAVEFEAALAERAKQNLAPFPHVTVAHGNGASMQLGAADMILVNAGATGPAAIWLDALKDQGRLVLPLTAPFTTKDGHRMTFGGIFLIERVGDDFVAQWKSTTAIYPCVGLRDPSAEASLSAAFAAGGAERVTRLYRTSDISDDLCWARGPGWALAYS
jgi:protein-L-isoaspartate(D-aspartate) O-methyltransferase